MRKNRITPNQINQLLTLSIEVGDEAIILESDGKYFAAKDMYELSIRGMSAVIRSNPLKKIILSIENKMKEFKERLRSLKKKHFNNLKTVRLQDDKGEFDIEFSFV